MGLFLMVSLACLFGYAFTAHHCEKIRQLQLELKAKDREISLAQAHHENQVQLLKNTIRELL